MADSKDSTDAAIAALIREWDSAYYYGDRAIDDLAQRIRALVEAAVGAEREAIAQMFERTRPDHPIFMGRSRIAAAIRARTQGGGKGE